MQQDPFFQQPALAQASQLGALEHEYAPDPGKVLAFFSPMLVFALIAPFILYAVFGTATNPILFIPSCFLIFLLVGGGITRGSYLRSKQQRVYVYTNGLLYLKGNSNRVIYWTQIVNTSPIRGGNLLITLQDADGISIPSYFSRFDELRDRIKQEIGSYSEDIS